MAELGDTLEPVQPTPPPLAGFADKVASVFATRVAILGSTVLTALVITHLLSPEERGAYVAVVTLPGMLAALATFGLPGAVQYWSGRGASIAGLVRSSLILTAIIASAIVGVVWVSLPFLEQSVLRAAPDHLARAMLIVVPCSLLASFGGMILYGRQEVRVYNLILLGQAAGALTGAIVLVGVFDLGVAGAAATSIIVSIGLVVAVMADVARVGLRDSTGEITPLRSLITYGLRLYPSSFSGYFNNRADASIMQAMAPSAEVAKINLGLYSWAVTMAEVVFLVPDSVANLFLPRVAASSHEEASAMLGRVLRMTMLTSILIALLMIPLAFVGVPLLVPQYVDCMPAFLVILPGVVAFSLGRVAAGYVGGRGRPGPASVAATVSLVVNVPLNIALIPVVGIVGASLSSVVSYSALAAMMIWYASRVSGQPILALCIPRRDDLSLVGEAIQTVRQRSSAPLAAVARRSSNRLAASRGGADRPLRIAYLGNANSIHLRRWAGWFAERGHEVTMLVPDDLEVAPGLPPTIAVRTYSMGSSRPLRGRRILTSRRSIRDVVAAVGPDVLHVHHLTVHGFKAWLSGFHPYVVTVWGSDVLVTAPTSLRARLLARLALRSADLVTGISGHVVEAAIKLGAKPEKSRRLHFGVDVDRFAPGPGSAALRHKLRLSGHKVVFSPRAIAPIYRHDIVIEALAQLPDNIVLVMAGFAADATETEALVRLIEARGLTSRVTMLAGVAYCDMPNHYRLADVVVSVPESDAGPVSLVEALAVGKPTVCSNLPPARDWLADIDPECLVPVGDAAATARAIAAVLARDGSARAKLAVLGRQRVLERADQRRNMTEMEVLYRRLAEGSSVANDGPGED